MVMAQKVRKEMVPAMTNSRENRVQSSGEMSVLLVESLPENFVPRMPYLHSMYIRYQYTVGINWRNADISIALSEIA